MLSSTLLNLGQTKIADAISHIPKNLINILF